MPGKDITPNIARSPLRSKENCPATNGLLVTVFCITKDKSKLLNLSLGRSPSSMEGIQLSRLLLASH